MKLGKLAPKHDPRTLHLANYLKTENLPTIPTQVNWSSKIPVWGAMENLTIGDCTIAAAGHLIEEWTANASSEAVPADSDIVAAYSAVSGYDPTTGANDDGAVEIDVLNYWRQTGIAGHKIDAYAALEPSNSGHVQASIYLFGGCYIGLALPLSAQNQKLWSVTRGPNASPGSWGGHAVPIIAYDRHTLICVTWGQLQQMTWSFWHTYCDEAYAALSRDFINAQNVAPNSLDWASLQGDLNAVTG
jgi:hypothetical protein